MKNNDDYTLFFSEEKLIEMYAALPENVKDAIFSVDGAKRIMEIGQGNGLNIAQIGELGRQTGMVMVGALHPKNFIRELESRLRVNHERAASIAKEINRQIFFPVREALKKMHDIGDEEEIAGEAVSQEDKENLQRQLQEERRTIGPITLNQGIQNQESGSRKQELWNAKQETAGAMPKQAPVPPRPQFQAGSAPFVGYGQTQPAQTAKPLQSFGAPPQFAAQPSATVKPPMFPSPPAKPFMQPQETVKQSAPSSPPTPKTSLPQFSSAKTFSYVSAEASSENLSGQEKKAPQPAFHSQMPPLQKQAMPKPYTQPVIKPLSHQESRIMNQELGSMKQEVGIGNWESGISEGASRNQGQQLGSGSRALQEKFSKGIIVSGQTRPLPEWAKVGMQNQEATSQNQESGIKNQELGSINQEARIRNQEAWRVRQEIAGTMPKQAPVPPRPQFQQPPSLPNKSFSENLDGQTEYWHKTDEKPIPPSYYSAPKPIVDINAGLMSQKSHRNSSAQAKPQPPGPGGDPYKEAIE